MGGRTDIRTSGKGMAVWPAPARCREAVPGLDPLVEPPLGRHPLQAATAHGDVRKAASQSAIFADPMHTNLNGCAPIRAGACRRKNGNRRQSETGSGAHVMFARMLGSGRQCAAGHVRGQGEKNCHADI
ncbi:hypothetical protein [Blastochloris tepida]|uniref:Uncharacterized protein n=1 Tax=Blastochloris tepida TaxID=2233851 RepID=A0A348FYZ6_9HYPH|nr:hypothetical protein [Blastochloris tepida]BBF92529.1 hypothetical protein BLTE_12140 [Blastochloris tepida]